MRKPLYSVATHGKSDFISDLLILSEKITVFTARSWDSRIKPFADAGIPLICSDFSNMAPPPAFEADETPPGSTFDSINHPDFDRWKREIHDAVDAKDFDRISFFAKTDLALLSAAPEYFCIARHFLETIADASTKAAGYSELSQARGLDPEEAGEISLGFIDLQISYLPEAGWLDSMAASLQESGVPILCNDLPRRINASRSQAGQ